MNEGFKELIDSLNFHSRCTYREALLEQYRQRFQHDKEYLNEKIRRYKRSSEKHCLVQYFQLDREGQGFMADLLDLELSYLDSLAKAYLHHYQTAPAGSLLEPRAFEVQWRIKMEDVIQS